MAGKKLPKNVDFAAGFFSTPPSEEPEEAVSEKIVAPAPVPTESPVVEEQETEPKEPAKNLGGRPKKEGLKNEQFTLTMNPETYEKLRIIADDHTRGNFSALIDEAIKVYCKENNINMADIEVPETILEAYRIKQEKKSKKKK